MSLFYYGQRMVSNGHVGERDRRYTQINRTEQDPGSFGNCCISSEPVTGISVPLTSVVFPDSTRTDVDNFAYPDRENITPKVPGSILSMIRGVLPRYCPSMISDAPSGEVLRLSVPGISGELIFITGVPSFMEIVL